MRRLPLSHLLDLSLLGTAGWAVLAPSRTTVVLAVAAGILSVRAPRRDAPPAPVAAGLQVRPVVVAAPRRPGGPALVQLPPRRPAARAPVSVTALAGEPFVRPLRTAAPPAGRLRVVGSPGTPRALDGALIAAGWELATRDSARRVDAAAVRLGLAADEPRTVWATDPDPLLLAATWPGGARAAA